MPALLKYALMGLWFLWGYMLARGALMGRPVKGGMVQTRPPLRSSWPLFAVIWVAGGFILFFILMPYN